MAEKTTLDWIALILLIVGGINWLLVGLGWNLVAWIFDSWAPVITTIIYILVGVAALYTIYFLAKK